MPSVLQITDKPSPGGGIRRVVDQQRRMLEGRGWQCRELRLVRQGTVAPEGVLTAPVEVSPRLTAQSASVAAITHAARSVDVVHLHLGFLSLSAASVAAAASVAPLVVSLHDVAPFEGLDLPEFGIDARQGRATLATRLNALRLRPVRRALWHAICRDARSIVAPSQYLARLAEAAGAPPARIVVVPHAVDPVQTEPPIPSACDPVIVYAGLLSEDKGAPLLLKAFGQLRSRQAWLVFVGDGPARARMEKAAHPPEVTFLGHLPPADVASMIARCRVLVHPSLVPEGFGLAGIEAMQMGRPVVGFGLGGCPDWLIADRTGLVASRQDAAALAESLDRVLADDALADRLGAAGRVLVRDRFCTARVSDALHAVLSSAIRVRAGQG